MSRVENFIMNLTDEDTYDAAEVALSNLRPEQVIDLVLGALDDSAKADLLEMLREELGEEDGVPEPDRLAEVLADARPYVEHAADDPAEPDNPAAEVLRRLDAALAHRGAA